MNLTNPNALLWLLLAIPLVIFYILKIRLKRVPVSTVLFWNQIFDEKKPRSLWQRLRHLISLAVQLALLALLVSAIAEPFLSSESKNRRRVILVIDQSASMTATDVLPNRLGKAREESHAIIKGLRFRDEMAIIEAGGQPRVVCGLTGHHRTLRTALDGITPSDSPTKLADAIAIARRLSSDGQESETKVVIVTDAAGDALKCVQDDEAKKPVEQRLALHIIRIGEKTPNLGITRFQVRRSTFDPIGYEVLIEVTNPSEEPPRDDARLIVTLNGRDVLVEPIKLAAGGVWSKVIENTTADGGVLTAELMAKVDGKDAPYPDALLADNKAFALLPKREKFPVHLHAPQGNLFLQKVLEANALVTLTTSRELPKEFAAGAIKVFHREVPPVLPSGNVLVVEPTADCSLWKLGDKLPAAIVTKQDKDSPFLAHVRLDNVVFPDARVISFANGVKAQVLLASLNGEPLLSLIERPEGKVVVLTGDLDRGELPFRTAFPILAMNTLGVFVGSAGELKESLATGATASVILPGGEFQLQPPTGTARKIVSNGSPQTVGPFDQVGVWQIKGTAVVEEFAVNLMSKTESDLRPAELPDAVTTATDTGLVSGFGGRPIWWYLTIAGLVLMVLEWYLYQRRWIN